MLRWLVAHGEPEAEKYADQIDRVNVSTECSCGCPTIKFGLEGQPHPLDGEWVVVADVVGKSPEGVGVNVLLHVHAGTLWELEVFSVDGRAPFSLPKPEDLKAWEDAAV